jgi:hypothetical protein
MRRDAWNIRYVAVVGCFSFVLSNGAVLVGVVCA